MGKGRFLSILILVFLSVGVGGWRVFGQPTDHSGDPETELCVTCHESLPYYHLGGHRYIDCLECHLHRPRPGYDTIETVSFVAPMEGELCLRCHLGGEKPASLALGSRAVITQASTCTEWTNLEHQYFRFYCSLCHTMSPRYVVPCSKAIHTDRRLDNLEMCSAREDCHLDFRANQNPRWSTCDPDNRMYRVLLFSMQENSTSPEQVEFEFTVFYDGDMPTRSKECGDFGFGLMVEVLDQGNSPVQVRIINHKGEEVFDDPEEGYQYKINGLISIQETVFSWDTSTVEAGTYSIKLTPLFDNQPAEESLMIPDVTVGGATYSLEIIGYHYRDSQGNDRFTTPVEDHSLLTSEDALVVEVVAPDPDPSVRNTISIRAFSQNDPSEITLLACESGLNTGVFYNYNPGDGDNPDYPYSLYLGETTSGNVLRVDNENETITVYIEDLPEVKGTAILDLAEVGVGWIQASPQNCIFINLVNTKPNAELLHDSLNTGGWVSVFNNGGSACQESQYDREGDSGAAGVDTVDFAVWAGHGPARDYSEDFDPPYPPGTYIWHSPALHFPAIPHSDVYPRSDDHDLCRNEIAWGDNDLDWVALFTCSFLRNPDSLECRQIGNGVRMVCGFTDVMLMLPPQHMAKIFTDLITDPESPWPIKDAWLKMTSLGPPDSPDISQPGIGAVVFDSRAANDHLPGFGPYARQGPFGLNDYEVEEGGQ